LIIRDVREHLTMCIHHFARFMAGLLRSLGGEAADVQQDRPLSAAEKLDRDMMGRCIELSKQAAAYRELPFASIICDGDEILAEVTNRVFRRSDVTQHAEFLAVSEAQSAYGRKRLANCTIYSNVEPCVMCSMSIREAGIARVVFAIRSAHMGGYSKWNVIEDRGLSSATRGYYRKPPVVITGLMTQEAEKVWRNWNPIIWTVIKWRGLFGGQFTRSARSSA
jgi:tRNA(adenine34) deaminase